MAEQFNYSSVLAPYMKHLLEVKSSQGISAHRTKWILKEIDDFANSEGLSDAHITEAFVKKWRATRIADCDSTLYAKYSSPTLHRIYSLRNRCLASLLPQTVSGSMTSAWELR